MTAKHTPGPWTIARSSRGYPYQIDAPNGSRGPGGIRSVTRWAAISLPTSAEGEANARLIVSAPDLLEAAKLALQVAEQVISSDYAGTSAFDGMMAELAPVRAAIAKAEGAP
jgi:hypothetical protein